jgi:hypothetical protein
MKKIFTSSRPGGALAVLVLAIFLIIGGLFVGKSIVDTKSLEAEARTTELETLQKRLRAPIPPAPQSIEAANAFLEGTSLALAANSLQQRIVRFVDASGGTLATIGVDPLDAADDVAGRRVVVQARCEFDNDGLQKFIYQLESERPFILIDTLDVRRISEDGAQEGGKQNSSRLIVNVRVISYYRRAAR